MTLFLISVLVVLSISACCSLTEAAIYAIRTPYVRRLSESGSASGQVLARFKENMERPITAILILNTAANTAGAAVAGAQARTLFGEGSLLWFSSLFTLSVLVFSEILPKVLGVVYSQPVARLHGVALELGHQDDVAADLDRRGDHETCCVRVRRCSRLRKKRSNRWR